jgi:hypothetical protein
MGVILLAANLFPDRIFSSQHTFSNRFRKLVVFNEVVDHSRIELWKRAYHIICEFPITGSGVGTFYRLSKDYQNPQDSFYLGQSENAHNYFLQLAAEVGLPALIVLVIIICIVYRKGRGRDAKEGEEGSVRKALLFGAGAYLVTCLSGHPLILPNQQLLFWFLIAGVQLGRIDEKKVDRPQGSLTKGILVAIAVMVLIGAYWNKLGRTRSGDQNYAAGFYEVENWKGKNFRWMGKVGLLKFERKGEILSYEVYCAPQNIGRRGLNYKIFINGEEWEDIHFFRGRIQPIHFYLPERMGRWIEMKGVASRTFVPAEKGLGPDTRILGVAMSEIKFVDVLPEDGIGFYGWEYWKGPPVNGWPASEPLKFRWTQKQASLPCPRDAKTGMQVFIMAANPKIHRNPVKVRILADGKEVHEEMISTHQWRGIFLGLEKLKESNIITFWVSQTWNPKSCEVSEDGRDLGVAIAILQENFK